MEGRDKNEVGKRAHGLLHQIKRKYINNKIKTRRNLL